MNVEVHLCRVDGCRTAVCRVDGCLGTQCCTTTSPQPSPQGCQFFAGSKFEAGYGGVDKSRVLTGFWPGSGRALAPATSLATMQCAAGQKVNGSRDTIRVRFKSKIKNHQISMIYGQIWLFLVILGTIIQ